MSRQHVFPTPGLTFPQTLHEDRHRLEDVEIPVVTVSASFRKEISQLTGEKSEKRDEIVFSRAHYSMAVAILSEAERRKKSTWLVDPTNYIAEKDWQRVKFMEKVGHLIARNDFLKKLKEISDALLRNNSQLSKAIENTLLYVTARTAKTIVSLHYETGNILAKNGKKVLQVVTDPYVHKNYLFEAQRPNIYFAVFDEETQDNFLKMAKNIDKDVDKKRVVVTGPPVDPRILKFRQTKDYEKIGKRPLRIVVATSGLGANKEEIRKVVEVLLSCLERFNLELILYAGTHKDFFEMFISLCKDFNLDAGEAESDEKIRIIYKESIIEANQALIDYAFSWADGFVTKPSGDMAYDGVASGCFLLSLDPWGSWEKKIQEIFFDLGLLQKVKVNSFSDQLAQILGSGWARSAQKKTLGIDKLFLDGARNIVDLQQRLQ